MTRSAQAASIATGLNGHGPCRLRDLLSSRRRPARMTRLLALIVVLSLADLLLTLGHMSTTGMFEANPLVARLALLTESGLSIVNFKALTVLVGVSLLYRLRRHGQAEVAAWLVVLILIGLSIQWALYADQMSEIGPMVVGDAVTHGAHWVVLD